MVSEYKLLQKINYYTDSKHACYQPLCSRYKKAGSNIAWLRETVSKMLFMQRSERSHDLSN